MQAHIQDHILTAIDPTEAEQHKIAHLFYQGGTLLAMLLFLISFWSC